MKVGSNEIYEIAALKFFVFVSFPTGLAARGAALPEPAASTDAGVHVLAHCVLAGR